MGRKRVHDEASVLISFRTDRATKEMLSRFAAVRRIDLSSLLSQVLAAAWPGLLREYAEQQEAMRAAMACRARVSGGILKHFSEEDRELAGRVYQAARVHNNLSRRREVACALGNKRNVNFARIVEQILLILQFEDLLSEEMLRQSEIEF